MPGDRLASPVETVLNQSAASSITVTLARDAFDLASENRVRLIPLSTCPVAVQSCRYRCQNCNPSTLLNVLTPRLGFSGS